VSIRLTVNGVERDVDVAPETPLLWVVRDLLGLTGTKFGCGLGQCGACTLHVDGVATRSCVTPAGSLGRDQRVTTIEALSADGEHPVQRAWIEEDVAQCGYCQPGQIMMAASLLRWNATPTEKEIEEAMSGNLCRCGTYPRIRRAIERAGRPSAAGSKA
jgi:aerobic-type carbon monoxide dehydrogenase small subunit (CoxS/CutS family)